MPFSFKVLLMAKFPLNFLENICSGHSFGESAVPQLTDKRDRPGLQKVYVMLVAKYCSMTGAAQILTTTGCLIKSGKIDVLETACH